MVKNSTRITVPSAFADKNSRLLSWDLCVNKTYCLIMMPYLEDVWVFMVKCPPSVNRSLTFFLKQEVCNWITYRHDSSKCTYQRCRRKGGGAMPPSPPVLGRSVNPILPYSNQGGRLCSPHYYWHPWIFRLLRPWVWVSNTEVSAFNFNLKNIE